MNQIAIVKQFVSAVYPLDDAAMEKFISIWMPGEAKRKTILTYAGDTERNLYFITEGVHRVYYFDGQDRDATIVFTYAPSFGGVADSFLTQTASRFFAETLTPSSFLKTTFSQLDALMKADHQIERLIRLATNYAFAGVLERMIEIQCFTSEEKFKALLKRSPHILNLIPHKYIASYLGIDATNFSKLLGKVRL